MDLTIDFNDTNVKTLLVPIVASFITIAFLRVSAGPWRGSILAPLGIGKIGRASCRERV